MTTLARDQHAILSIIVAITVIIILKKRRLPHPQSKVTIPYPSGEFHLDNWPDEYIRKKMRFSKDDIRLLATKLELENIVYRQRIKPDPTTALCLVLAKLAWPDRLFTLQQEMFHKSLTWISVTVNDVCVYLYDRYYDLVAWHPMLDDYDRLEKYAAAIAVCAGVPDLKVWAFIDGTFRGVCRPHREQRDIYSGHKKEHGIKWQGIITPDGIIGLQGPYEGRINDWKMYYETKIEERLQAVCRDRETMYLYGDPAYTASYGIVGPYRTASHPTSDEIMWNTRMSKVRIAIEHGFGIAQQKWSNVAWALNMKSGLQPVAAYYFVSVLLTNCYTCLYGNQVSDQFLMRPPSLDYYLGNYQ